MNAVARLFRSCKVCEVRMWCKNKGSFIHWVLKKVKFVRETKFVKNFFFEVSLTIVLECRRVDTVVTTALDVLITHQEDKECLRVELQTQDSSQQEWHQNLLQIEASMHTIDSQRPEAVDKLGNHDDLEWIDSDA